MSSKESNYSDSKHCQLMQIHIDAFLDGELESERLTEFQRHLEQCSACRQELAWARALHQAVMSLPALNCTAATLEPVERMLSAAGRPEPAARVHWWSDLLDALRVTPVYVRYAIPTLVVIAVLAGMGRGLLLPGGTQQQGSLVANNEPAGPAANPYTEAEVRQAMADLRVAMQYLESVSERTGIMVRDRFVLQQLDESINASFRTRNGEPRFGLNGRGDGPI